MQQSSKKSPKHAAARAGSPGKGAPKQRLDTLLLERSFAPSRRRAQAIVLAGKVLVDGRRVEKAGTLIARDAGIEIVGEALRYASRGGMKLEGALDDFGAAAEGKVCLDAGSSAGGFTDCLLQRGARRVYAVDVTVRQLAWRLQQDPRVVLVERNARHLKPEEIGEKVDLVTVDVSFISVSKLLPALAATTKPDAEFVILIKPQFELEREDVGRGGVVRDPLLHKRAIDRVTLAAERAGLLPLAVLPSRLLGAEGNREFFLHARRRPVE